MVEIPSSSFLPHLKEGAEPRIHVASLVSHLETKGKTGGADWMSRWVC